MSDKNWQKAEELAARQYFTIIQRDETENGEYYYVAINPDFPGCIADGQTPEEAKQELAKARVDFIYYLLEDNLLVPDPGTYEIAVEPEQIEQINVLPEQELPIPHSGYKFRDLVPA